MTVIFDPQKRVMSESSWHNWPFRKLERHYLPSYLYRANGVAVATRNKFLVIFV